MSSATTKSTHLRKQKRANSVEMTQTQKKQNTHSLPSTSTTISSNCKRKEENNVQQAEYGIREDEIPQDEIRENEMREKVQRWLYLKLDSNNTRIAELEQNLEQISTNNIDGMILVDPTIEARFARIEGLVIRYVKCIYPTFNHHVRDVEIVFQRMVEQIETPGFLKRN